jgi:hypothetical protein
MMKRLWSAKTLALPTKVNNRCGQDLRSTDLASVWLRMPLAAFGSKRPSHPPRVKADHKHYIDWHAKDNVKHRHEQYGFLQYQCL